jgi:cytochrome c
MLKWVLAAGLVMALPAVGSANDVEKGKLVFNKCRACHDIGEGAKNKVGPQLNGIVGRKAGTAEGFNYSDAMKNSGIVWDDDNIDAYMADPKGKIPGNKMVFVGIKDKEDRENVIAFLKSSSK